MGNTKQSKFVSTLTRDNKSIRADRAQRIGKKVANAQAKLIMELEENIASDEDKLEAMMDLSADNKNTSMNVVSPSFDGKDFVVEFQAIQVRLKVNREKLGIAQETSKEWFE